MTTKTTTHLTLARQLDRPPIIVAIVVAVFALSGLIAAIGHGAWFAPQQPIIIVATPALPRPAATPAGITVAAAAAPNVTTRAIVAYAAPDGAVAGAIEAGRHYRFLTRSGDRWLQLAIDGSGPLWVRSADLIGADGLADIATPTSAPAPVYQIANTVPTPAQCFHAERQAMLHGTSIGVGIGDSCISQQEADQQAAQQAFAQMNAAAAAPLPTPSQYIRNVGAQTNNPRNHAVDPDVSGRTLPVFAPQTAVPNVTIVGGHPHR